MADSTLPETQSAPAGATYDETPYPSTAFPQTHPDRLAAMGRFFGLAAKSPARARVLELGCADGSNLLPMAQYAPEASFLGIDASAKQVAAAQAAIAGAGLTNIEIRHQNLLDLPADTGKFDYILAHGIYSWVPVPVREKILAICREHLAENGIAFVSYNAYPGWGMRMALRDMMMIHTGALTDTKEKVRQARALLAFLSESVPTENNPYGLLLKQELDRMKGYSDNYLRHDILEEINHPFYFHEFMQQAAAAELQYLGEPSIDQMLASNFAPKVQETLTKLGNNMIAREQYMDFLRNRNFRQTLLVHRGARLNRQVAPEVLKEFCFISTLSKPAEPLDLKQGVAQSFPLQGTKSSLSISDTFLKAAFAALADAGQHRTTFAELLAAGRAGGPPANAPADAGQRAGLEEATLLQNLIQLYSRGIVTTFVERPMTARAAPEKPVVSSLVRYQALHSRQITSPLHLAINVDAMARHIVAALDGTNDVTAIVEKLVTLTKSGELRAVENDQPVEDEEKLRGVYRQRVEVVVPRLAGLGFFPA